MYNLDVLAPINFFFCTYLGMYACPPPNPAIRHPTSEAASSSVPTSKKTSRPHRWIHHSGTENTFQPRSLSQYSSSPMSASYQRLTVETTSATIFSAISLPFSRCLENRYRPCYTRAFKKLPLTPRYRLRNSLWRVRQPGKKTSSSQWWAIPPPHIRFPS